MDIGLAVGLFLLIAIIVMILFCIVTKYFNYRLNKALEDENEVYSAVQDLKANSDDEDAQGDYQEFVKKRQEKKQKENEKPNQFEIQMNDVKAPLDPVNADIYGIGKLKRKLQGTEAMQLRPESNRSVNTLKSFRPQKLMDSNRSQRESDFQNDNQQENPKTKPKKKNNKKQKEPKKNKDIVEHKFTNKIVCYNEEGLNIYEAALTSLKRDADTKQIIQKKIIKKVMVTPKQSGFQDQLEIYGFQKGNHGCFKFTQTVLIPHMKDGQSYAMTTLKATEQKDTINFLEFFKLKEIFDSSSGK